MTVLLSQVDLRLQILLPHPPKWWDYRHVEPQEWGFTGNHNKGKHKQTPHKNHEDGSLLCPSWIIPGFLSCWLLFCVCTLWLWQYRQHWRAGDSNGSCSYQCFSQFNKRSWSLGGFVCLESFELLTHISCHLAPCATAWGHFSLSLGNVSYVSVFINSGQRLKT